MYQLNLLTHIHIVPYTYTPLFLLLRAGCSPFVSCASVFPCMRAIMWLPCIQCRPIRWTTTDTTLWGSVLAGNPKQTVQSQWLIALCQSVKAFAGLKFKSTNHSHYTRDRRKNGAIESQTSTHRLLVTKTKLFQNESMTVVQYICYQVRGMMTMIRSSHNSAKADHTQPLNGRLRLNRFRRGSPADNPVGLSVCESHSPKCVIPLPLPASVSSPATV